MSVKRLSISIGFIIFIILLSGFLAACQTTPESTTPSSAGISIEITDDLCPNVEIQVGQQVTWTNKDGQAHVVEASMAEGTSQFESGTLQPEDSFTFTFTEAGSYTYTCSVDSVNTIPGTITVQP